MAHPHLFTTICMTAILCWSATNISEKYLDAKRQEHAAEQAKALSLALSEQLQMEREAFVTLAKDTLSSNNATMRTVAELTAPIKRTGGFALFDGERTVHFKDGSECELPEGLAVTLRDYCAFMYRTLHPID